MKGLNILVTGGTGSFGQAFVRRVLPMGPARLVVFSRDELKQFEMQKEFPMDGGPMRYFLGDVRDRDRLRRAFEGVDVVVAAAALKQVPAVEYNPIEAVKTNIMGAVNIIEAALDAGVKKVMGLSSDKAVAALNLYGMTKAVMEKLFIQANAYRGSRYQTKFSCTRYGNVLGSRGSVMPLFREQAKGGRLTLTHRDMTRFWLTLGQGVDFVLSSLEMMGGGEVFVPKVPSMRMWDVAKAIAPEAEIELIGVRPGEKLHEVLVAPGETAVDVGDRYVVCPQHSWWVEEKWRDKGHIMPDGWSYTSDTNPRKLTKEEFLEMADAG